MRNNKIPKIIHYIWLGKKEKNELVKKCIDSWSKYNPNYQIIEWNEFNYKITNPQIKKALEEKNYAYASDIIRIDVLNKYGGIYLDTDLELIGSLDFLLNYDLALSYEAKYWFGTAFIAASKGNKVLKFLLKRYHHDKEINFKTNYLTVHAFTAYLRYFHKLKPNNKLSVVDGMLLLPKDYFYPIDYMSLKMKKTNNTVGIHYYGSSWHNKKQHQGYRFSSRVKRILGKNIFYVFEKIFAYVTYKRLKKEFKKIDEENCE